MPIMMRHANMAALLAAGRRNRKARRVGKGALAPCPPSSVRMVGTPPDAHSRARRLCPPYGTSLDFPQFRKRAGRCRKRRAGFGAVVVHLAHQRLDSVE